ncbi:hypothetical protein [Vibrio sp.]|uniref:DUF6812 domain-containing protein n=1 Tax=Vibrio sp. TaxID=678 RepID=UPI00311E790C
MEITRNDLTMVQVTLMDGVTNVKKMQGAYIYLAEGQRLSDLMNDGRSFLPIYKLDTMYTGTAYDIVMINKAAIAMIEEQEETSYGHRRY